jgi:thiamine transport system permease protein
VVFLFCATAFGVVLTMGGVRYATVETEIYLLTTNLLDLQAAAALSFVQLVVVTGLLALTQRVRPAGGRGSPVTSDPRPARRGDALVLTAAGCVMIALAAPIATLALGSVRVRGGWGLDHYRSLGTATEALVVPVTSAMGTSLRTAVDATWMSVGLGLTVALLVTRPSRGRLERRLRAGLDSLFMLPLGVSAVTVGFGFLITLDRPPLNLRDSPILVPIAQALVALPLVVRTIAPVLGGIDDRQRQAARSLGAGPVRTVLAVDLPALWRPLLGAAGFAFAVSLGEFGATSFLARDTHPTMPVVIYRLIGLPGVDNYGMALAAAVLLAAVTALVVLSVEQLRVPSVGAW